MASRKPDLFADAMIPAQIVNKLRRLGYDVKTVQQHQGTSKPDVPLADEDIMEIATVERRAVVTLNETDFRSLHDLKRGHKGIIICDHTMEWTKRAKEIDAAIKAAAPLTGKVIYVPSQAHDK